jgi:hypothetical protein
MRLVVAMFAVVAGCSSTSRPEAIQHALLGDGGMGVCSLNLSSPYAFSYTYAVGNPAPAQCHVKTTPGGPTSFYVQSERPLDPALGLYWFPSRAVGQTAFFSGNGTADLASTGLQILFGDNRTRCGVWSGSATVVSGRPNMRMTFDLTCQDAAGVKVVGEFQSVL